MFGLLLKSVGGRGVGVRGGWVFRRGVEGGGGICCYFFYYIRPLTLLILQPSGTAPSDRDSNEDRHHDASDHHPHPPRGRNAPKRLPPRTACLTSFPAKTACSASTGNPSEDAAERERSRDGPAMRMDLLKEFRRRLLLVLMMVTGQAETDMKARRWYILSR